MLCSEQKRLLEPTRRAFFLDKLRNFLDILRNFFVGRACVRSQSVLCCLASAPSVSLKCSVSAAISYGIICARQVQ